jgi:hypothetical protein
MKKTPERESYGAMMNRCYNPNATNYKYYGGRGIKVSERWKGNFQNFRADLGPRPPGCTLDRINNNGDYEPGNVRWATKIEQANNQSTTHLVAVDGRPASVSQLSRDTGVDRRTLHKRLKSGWDIGKAIQKKDFSTRAKEL